MKKVFAWVAASLMAAVTVSAQNPVAPSALQLGDTIAIVSLGSTPKAGVAEDAARVLQQWGFHVLIGKNVYANHGMYAGTVQQRLDDFLWALRNPSVKAIISTRGGYGTSLLLPELPLDTLRRYAKWVVGYSDITSMHSAMVRAGVMSIHGNMCGALQERGADDAVNLLMRDVLTGKHPTYIIPGHALNHTGSASGILVGGNMAVFSNLAGSKDYDFLDRDFVAQHVISLLMEDVSESRPRVMSMLYQLKLTGVIDRVKGIIVGRYTDYPHPAYGYDDMPQLLDEYLQTYNIPICYDFPASHDEGHNYPLLEGCPVTLTVTPHQATIKFE